jgi:uncharacterized protein
MSEYINNVTQRKEILKNVLHQLHQGRSVEEVKEQFGELARQAGSAEIAEIEQMLIDEGQVAVEDIQMLCDVHVAVFQDSLDEQLTPQETPGHPVHTFIAENQLMVRFLAEMKRTLDEYVQGDESRLKTLTYQLDRLKEFDRHYRRKEHLLFPYLEIYGFMGPSQVMWGIHDQIRAMQRDLSEILSASGSGSNGTSAAPQVAALFSQLSEAVESMVYKEEKILLPASLELLKEEDWIAIRDQEDEIGHFLLVPGMEWKSSNKKPPVIELVEDQAVQSKLENEEISLETGSLTPEQISLIFCHLPVDITFVDENDTVRFFSKTKDRIFERPPAIIGRKVQNCHPPQSVDRVQGILDDFRAGRRDSADFWIQMQGKFIHIRYFAVRDEGGIYKGTVEVTQEISEIRKLEGERRLLDD